MLASCAESGRVCTCVRLQVRSVLDLFYGYLKKGCCDGLCEKRLQALTTLHLRGMHFKVRGGSWRGGVSLCADHIGAAHQNALDRPCRLRPAACTHHTR